LELVTSKEFYILSTDIFKMLSLNISNRNTDPKEYLELCYSRYVKLIEGSCITQSKMRDDKLAPIPTLLERSLRENVSSNTLIETSSNDSNNSI
jgi:predicted lipase